LFSMPLAYPSTLDRRPPAARARWLPSFVEGLWSPSLVSTRRNGSVKQRRMPQRLFQRERRGSFSLRRGLDSSSELLQAGHHLSLP
jgi:hypothetical protein